MSYIALFNSKLMPCPGTHYLHTKKFLSGFEIHGYTFIEISDAQGLSILGKDDLVYISNHGLAENCISELFQIKKCGALPIFWYGHDHLDMISSVFSFRFLLTGEHFRKAPTLEPHFRYWKMQNGLTNYVPLTFASGLAVNKIGAFSRQDKHSAHFIGNGYKRLRNFGIKTLSEDTIVINTPPFLSEIRRMEIFLSSRVALGWHSKQNLLNHVIVERVFEGLAFGNLVVTDHPDAHEVTDGIVEYVNNIQETLELIKKARVDKKYFHEKQELAYSFAKSYGTYENVALNFIVASKSL